jgi:serine/threonine-protein phosphatase 6 catalytic subunit
MEAGQWISTLESGKCLPEKDFYLLCDIVKEILIEENNVTPVAPPVVICGDIHG